MRVFPRFRTNLSAKSIPDFQQFESVPQVTKDNNGMSGHIELHGCNACSSSYLQCLTIGSTM